MRRFYSAYFHLTAPRGVAQHRPLLLLAHQVLLSPRSVGWREVLLRCDIHIPLPAAPHQVLAAPHLPNPHAQEHGRRGVGG